MWQATVTLKGESTAWGDATYGQLLTDRLETNLISVAAGALHSVAVRENGTVGLGATADSGLSRFLPA